MKYIWTEDGTNEPDISAFNDKPDCKENRTIKGTGYNGKRYLWVLLETGLGKTNICGSKAFKFDNENPTLDLELLEVQGVARKSNGYFEG